MRRWLYPTTLTLTALTLGLEFAHVLDWPPKQAYDGPLYVRLQESLYVWFGSVGAVVYVLAVACTVLLAVASRRAPSGRRAIVAAAVAEVVALGTFLTIIYPVNLRLPVGGAVDVPAGWQSLRIRWELGHAIGFVLFLAAFIALLTPLKPAYSLERT